MSNPNRTPETGYYEHWSIERLQAEAQARGIIMREGADKAEHAHSLYIDDRTRTGVDPRETHRAEQQQAQQDTPTSPKDGGAKKN